MMEVCYHKCPSQLRQFYLHHHLHTVLARSQAVDPLKSTCVQKYQLRTLVPSLGLEVLVDSTLYSAWGHGIPPDQAVALLDSALSLRTLSGSRNLSECYARLSLVSSFLRTLSGSRCLSGCLAGLSLINCFTESVFGSRGVSRHSALSLVSLEPSLGRKVLVDALLDLALSGWNLLRS